MEQIAPLILIIDDGPANIKMLEILLKAENYKTISATSGAQALEIIRDVIPDLILLDVMMPGMDGFEVSKKIKENEAADNVPIIFLSAKTEVNDIVHGFSLGAVDYITKPFNRIELLARVKTHIELKRSREKLKRSFLDLKESQQKIIELERRNSVLAMVATTDHEINQPLTVLSGSLYLLEESLDKQSLTGPQEEYLKKMHESIKKIHGILVKYRNSHSLRFEPYAGNSKIIVFDNDPKKPKM
jgi:two-component system sensor histidine kinase/response regulator